MKRIIILLAVCLTTVVFVGCTSSSTGRERTSFTTPANNSVTADTATSPLSPAVDP